MRARVRSMRSGFGKGRWPRNISGLLWDGSNVADLGGGSLNHASDRRLVSSLKRKGRKFVPTTVHSICQSADPDRNLYL
jgi:hypothetical protein